MYMTHKVTLFCVCSSPIRFITLYQVFFQPLSKTILTCFKDDSIHAWDSDNLTYKYQLPPPYGPTPHYRYSLTCAPSIAGCHC